MEPTSLVRRQARSAFDRVTLVIPPSLFLLDERVFMSLGILKVAAVLERAGVFVEMLDLSGVVDYVEAVRAHMRTSPSKVVGFTVTTPQLPATMKIVEALRRERPEVRTILGGPHPTLVHAAARLEKKQERVARGHTALAKLVATFDVIVAGDGEEAIFVALGESPPAIVDGDDPKTSLFMTSAFYNETPWPARHLVDVDSYKYTIEGHRAANLIAQLGCPFACTFSLTGDTLISTDRGFERLDSLLEGPGELERCVHGGFVRVHPVRRAVATREGWARGVEAVDEGKRPVFDVATENGLHVRATAEHPFLIAQGKQFVWKKVRELRAGDWLVLKDPQREWPSSYVRLPRPAAFPSIPPGGFQRKAHHTTPDRLTPDVAWFVGFMIGDGSIPLDGRPSVHVCVTPDVKSRLVRLTRELFNVKLSVRPASNTDKMEQGWIHSRLAHAFLTETMGIRPNDKLHVPDLILKSPRDVLSAFLRGLLDADGYDGGGGKSEYLTTVSQQLAREVANVMLMLGDVPSVQAIDGRGYGGGVHYRVGRLKNDRIPTDRSLYKSSKSGTWYWRTPRDPKHFLGVRRRTLRESGLVHPLDVDGFHYVRVESITRGLPERVYDLRVPRAHSFLADGLVSHNCGGRNSSMLRRIRTRTTESVVAEIEYLHAKYGFTAAMLHDDELNVNKSIVELMNEIDKLQKRLGTEFRFRGFVKAELFTDEQAEAMYRAGFRWILCGFEAAHERILRNINKKATLEDNTRVIEIARRHGLKVKALMSVGHAGESEDTIRAVRDWLLDVKPADFDCTVISTYPGTPYYDEAVPHGYLPDVWTYTAAKTGDRLYSYDIDYCEVADYYKGDPDGGYKSYVFTDHLTPVQIVELRDWVEKDVREKLAIPFNPGAPGIRFEHSMGATGALPPLILRTSDNKE